MVNWFRETAKRHESASKAGEDTDKFRLNSLYHMARLTVALTNLGASEAVLKEVNNKITMNNGVDKYPAIWDTLIDAGSETKNRKQFIETYKKAISYIHDRLKIVKGK